MEALHRQHAEQLSQLQAAMGLRTAEARLDHMAATSREILAAFDAARLPIAPESINDDDWYCVADTGEVVDSMPASTFRRMRFSAARLPQAPEGQQWLRGMVAKHRTLWRQA